MFAELNFGELLWTAIIVAFIWLQIARRMKKAREEEQLKQANPDAWVRLKEIEHDQHRMKHERGKMAAGIAGPIAKSVLSWLLKR